MSAPTTTVVAPGSRYLLIGATLLLALGGLLFIYSASSAADFVLKSDSAFHVKRQALFVVLGLVAMFVCSRASSDLIRRAGLTLLVIADGMLGLVLVMGVGKFGAMRAIDIGITTIQPAELARLACVIVMADILADRIRRPRPLKEDILKIGLVLGVPFALIMAQPDMGAAVSIVVPVFFLAVLAGMPARWVAGTVVGLVGGLSILLPMAAYRSDRIASFLDPSRDPLGTGYQIIQAKLAFGSGGLFGVGLGLSRQKYFYLPAAHTDFIFAIIGEEVGLVGTLIVVATFGLLCYAGIRISLSLRDPYARLVAGGLTITIVTQAVINMSSVTGLIPVAGEPLPLVSYGGSSMLFTMGCIGLILAMTRGGARASVRTRPHVDDTEGTSRARTGERRGDGRPHLSGIDGGRARQRRRA
ncbi:MAG: putative lipid II flippase FtsW [Coriobacteriia bacterium]|nr:putative lipid II flippase FtsW [Coriobacteriia bacterium]